MQHFVLDPSGDLTLEVGFEAKKQPSTSATTAPRTSLRGGVRNNMTSRQQSTLTDRFRGLELQYRKEPTKLEEPALTKEDEPKGEPQQASHDTISTRKIAVPTKSKEFKVNFLEGDQLSQSFSFTTPTRPPSIADSFLDHHPAPSCTMVVSSRHLAAVSPVWKAMLEPGKWNESTTGRVSMPDDDSKAMLLLLQIAHAKFNSIPKELDRGTLYHLAVLCDKYDCVELTSAWLQAWLKKLDFEGCNQPGMAFICWTFGLEKALGQVVSNLGLETLSYVTKRKTTSPLFLPVSKQRREYHFDHEIMPSHIMDTLKAEREKALWAIKRLLVDTFNKYSSRSVIVCQGTHNRELCHAAVLGSLQLGLSHLVTSSLSPKLLVDRQYTLHELCAEIRALKIWICPRDGDRTPGTFEQGHQKCNIAPNLTSQCLALLPEAEDILTESHRKHLKTQAAKCGTTDL